MAEKNARVHFSLGKHVACCRPDIDILSSDFTEDERKVTCKNCLKKMKVWGHEPRSLKPVSFAESPPLQ